MLLAIDIGNSSISLGLFDTATADLLHTFKLSPESCRTSDECAVLISSMLSLSGFSVKDIDGAMLASVVPQLTHTLVNTVVKLIGKPPLTVGPGIKTGFPIKIDYPSELGADLVADTAAVLSIQGRSMHGTNRKAAIIVDMGTATTVSAINRAGEYVGTAIMPGVRVSLDALHAETAQLPTVTPSAPERAIGKNSRDAVRSGVILGNAIMIDGLIDRFEKELKLDKGDAEVYATGGLAELIIPACKRSMIHEPHLTLKGLYRIYINNSDKA